MQKSGRLTVVILILVTGIGVRPVAAFAAEEPPVSFTTDILMYHEVTKAGLKQDIIGRLHQGQQLLSPETLVNVLIGRQQIPAGVRTFVVTLDDGLASQYEQGLPALEEIHRETGIFVPAVFFVMTKFDNTDKPMGATPDTIRSYRDGVHRYMTRGQLVDLLAKGYWVDNHTVDHANLPSLPEGARNAQVETGRQRINELWQLAGRPKPFQLFAYPNGSFQGQADFIRDLGYDAAFTTQPTNQHSDGLRFILGRMGKS